MRIKKVSQMDDIHDKETPLTEDEIKKAREMFDRLTANNEQKIFLEDWVHFNPNELHGRQIYESFSDNDLLAYVQKAAERFGHTPCKIDLHRLICIYLRRRFGVWNNVLIAAGLIEEEKEITEQDVAEKLAHATEEEYRLLFRTLKTAEFSEYPPFKAEKKAVGKMLAKSFDNKRMATAVMELLIKNENNGSLTEPMNNIDEKLAVIQVKAINLKRTPMIAELPEDVAFLLWRSCGSWRNVLYNAKLEPLESTELQLAQNKYMLDNASVDLLEKHIKRTLPDGDRKILQGICDMAKSLERAPAKGEIETTVFKRMNKISGSWQATLMQMGLCPLDEKTDRRISRTIQKKKKAGNQDNEGENHL